MDVQGMDGQRLTIAQAAEVLGVHPNTVRNHIKSGKIRADKVITNRGPTYLIPEGELTKIGAPAAGAVVIAAPAGGVDGSSHELTGRRHLEEMELLIKQIVEPVTGQLAEVTSQLRAADQKIGRLEAELEAALELLDVRESEGSSSVRRRWWRFW